MDIVAIVFLAIVGMVLLIILRQSRPEMALVLSVLLGHGGTGNWHGCQHVEVYSR